MILTLSIICIIQFVMLILQDKLFDKSKSIIKELLRTNAEAIKGWEESIKERQEFFDKIKDMQR